LCKKTEFFEREKAMKTKKMVFLLTVMVVVVGASGVTKVSEVAADEPAVAEESPALAESAVEEVKFENIQLPVKDTPEYWVVRSEAMGELTPLLTRKRADMKKKRQMLADYLLKIGRAEDMAAAEVKVPDDPTLYAKALGLIDEYKQQDIALPAKLPTWEETAQFSMRFVLYQSRDDHLQYRQSRLDDRYTNNYRW